MFDLSDLHQNWTNGTKYEFLFFWGHKNPHNAQSCLSQWYPAVFEIDSIQYPTAEHWMMASKARLFQDDQILEKILNTDDPGKAKKLGRQVSEFDHARWEENACDFVIQGNIAKFAQNPKLKKFLLSTGDTILVEASPYDQIWGIGLSQDDPMALSPETWKGKNLLGFCLIEVRKKLQELEAC